MVLLLLFEQELIEKIRFEVTEGEICWDTLYIIYLTSQSILEIGYSIHSLSCLFLETVLSSFRTKRTGLIGMKIGVTPQWTKEGKKITCTMVQVSIS